MSCSKMNDTFKQEFRVAIKWTKGSTTNGRYLAGVEIMEKHGLCYTLGPLEPRFFLTHKDNRGGLVLSPFNAHRKAATIFSTGADPSQLINAVCMELSVSGKRREQHIAANRKVIAASKGLLAPVNGQEQHCNYPKLYKPIWYQFG